MFRISEEIEVWSQVIVTNHPQRADNMERDCKGEICGRFETFVLLCFCHCEHVKLSGQIRP